MITMNKHCEMTISMILNKEVLHARLVVSCECLFVVALYQTYHKGLLVILTWGILIPFCVASLALSLNLNPMIMPIPFE